MSQTHENFGKYILLEKLGVGGMAEIWLSRSSGASGVSKFVAIKRILPQYTEQPEFIEMFKDEAKIAVNLSHANIVSIFEFGLEKQQLYLAMDYVEGRNLRQILNKMKKSGVTFSIEQVLYVIKEVSGGLDHAHRCIDPNTGKPLNIIHRDMSPQNIMVSFEGEVKVVDFGIAKAETQIENTRAGTLKGKFGYMSPEQAEGQSIDLRTDIFALGIVLWELLANDRLFVANNEVNTLRKIRDCQIPSLRKINPNIPPELERIVSKALAKDRNLRYQTAAAFHRELSRFLNRQYPDFSPHDFSVFIKTLFAAEILDSRKKMVEYAKIEIRPEAPQLGAAPSRFNADQTMTQATSTENSVGLLDFENVGIEKERSSSRRNAAMAQQPAPPAPSPNEENTATPTPAPSLTPAPPSVQVNAPPPPPAAHGPSSRANRVNHSEINMPPNLTVDRSFRESSYNRVPQGTMYTSSRSLSGTGVKSGGWPSLALPFVLIAFAITMGGAALVYSDPASSNQWTRMFHDLMGTGARNPNGGAGGTIEMPSVEYVSVGVSTTPPGAEVFINEKQQQDLTPMRISLPKHKEVRISFRLKGFATHEQTLTPTRHENLIVALKGDRKGYLDIQLLGAGIISVDGKAVAQNAPANRIPIPADREVVVRAYDPATKASDETRVKVSENATKKIVLIPRASIRRPDAPQKQ